MPHNVYQECPVYRRELITLRQTVNDDAEYLLKCYSDEKAVLLFNSDNCHGDDFHYTTVEQMKRAIDFWNRSYRAGDFVRWTIILNRTQEIIGTIEMFHRIANDKFNHCGVLRIDLQRQWEKEDMIEAILDVVNQYFFEAFEVGAILTKAIPLAVERIRALNKMGYRPLNEKLMIYDDYYWRQG